LGHSRRTLDHTRPVNDNCGWEHVLNDLTTFHDYTESKKLTETCATIQGILEKKSSRVIFLGPTSNSVTGDAGRTHTLGAPIICTEFGGINIAPAKNATVGEKDWGYTTAIDPEDLLKRIEGLVMGIVKGGLCCGFVYTQL
jgi:hypothetical protein